METIEDTQNDVSNVTILSNIALAPEQRFDNEYYKKYDIQQYENKKKWKNLIPGDLYADLFPEDLDLRGLDQNMTPKQIKEYKNYQPCSICGKRYGCNCKFKNPNV